VIKIDVRGIEQVRQYMQKVELGVKGVAARALAEYLIGNVQHGLKHYPPYKHVPYSQIGGFKSDKQRRYVMARIREGSIDPGISASNGYMRDAWKLSGEAPRYQITNDVGYAGYLVGDNDQSLHSQKQGWRTVTKNIADNIVGAFKHATDKVNEWLRSQK
jgi:hypothetical protein